MFLKCKYPIEKSLFLKFNDIALLKNNLFGKSNLTT